MFDSPFELGDWDSGLDDWDDPINSSPPELDGHESIPDTQEIPSPALAFIGATCTVAVIVFITLSLFL